MTDERLNQAIERLREQIRRLDPDDQESKDKLAALINSIQEKTGEKDGLIDQVKTAILQFEVKHPKLTEALNEIKSALYAIGL